MNSIHSKKYSVEENFTCFNTRISPTHQHDHTYNELYRWHIWGYCVMFHVLFIHHVQCCVCVDVFFVLLLFGLPSSVCEWLRVHCGSLSATVVGFYGPPHSCKPHVCVHDVWVGLTAWQCETPQKNWPSHSHVALLWAEGMCQCFYQCWEGDIVASINYIKRSNKGHFGLHISQTTNTFLRQICNNIHNNCMITMKMCVVEWPAQDTSSHHTSYCCNIACERVIIVVLPPHLSTQLK